MRPMYVDPLKKIRESLDMPTATLPEIVNVNGLFVVIDSVKELAKFELRSLTSSCDNRGYLKIWAGPGYTHAPFSPKF